MSSTFGLKDRNETAKNHTLSQFNPIRSTFAFKYNQAGEKVPFLCKKIFTFSAGGDQFSRCDQESCRQQQPPPLSSRAVQRERLLFLGQPKKSRIFEKERCFGSKIKRKSFYMEQCDGGDADKTRIAAELKRKKMICSEIQNVEHMKEPEEPGFV